MARKRKIWRCDGCGAVDTAGGAMMPRDIKNALQFAPNRRKRAIFVMCSVCWGNLKSVTVEIGHDK